MDEPRVADSSSVTSGYPSRSRIPVVRLVVLIVIVAWLVGEIRFVQAEPTLETLFPATGPASSNLALFSNGVRLRASSYNMFDQRYPAYAIDGNTHLGGTMQWESATDDATPWIDVSWTRPQQVRQLTLVVDSAQQSTRLFSVACQATGSDFVVKGHGEATRSKIVTIDVTCDSTTAVRLSFDPTPMPMKTVRITEFQVWGT